MPLDPSLPISELLKLDATYMAQIHAIDAAKRPWLSVKQTAALLGRSVRQIRRYQADGKMPPRKKFGRALNYSRTDIEKMLAAGLPR